MSRVVRWAGASLAGLLLAGLGACTVGPHFTPPTVQAPAQFGAEPPAASVTYAGAVDAAWWDSFHDAELSSLVHRLANQNLDLKIAAERIDQARNETRIAAAQGLPQVSANAAYTHTRQSPTGFISLITPAPGAPLEYNLWQDSVSVSWELDFFGRVRRSVEAANANRQAEVEARHGLALVTLADLAAAYMQLRDVQARIAILRQDLTLADRNLALVADRFRNGVATNLDQAQAAGQRATIAAALPDLQASEARLINAIGLLLAEPPRALESELSTPSPLPRPPARVAVGLPGDLVRRRPDVREAEARLHAAVAETGVATADFYPDVTLMGDTGMQGLHLANAFSTRSRDLNIGPSISLPIFQGGKLRATLRLRKSEQQQAAIAFQKTVLQAWRDADDALTAYAQAQRHRVQTAEALRQNEIALVAARQRYGQGAADFLNVISAQSALLNQQNALAQADAQVDERLVELYRVLGGGWGEG